MITKKTKKSNQKIKVNFPTSTRQSDIWNIMEKNKKITSNMRNWKKRYQETAAGRTSKIQDLMMTRNTQSAKLKGNLTENHHLYNPESLTMTFAPAQNIAETLLTLGHALEDIKYQHIDISSSYPKHLKELVKRFATKPSKEPMKVQTHKQTKASGICHQCSKHGTCKFGSRCRYKHVSRPRLNKGICHQFVKKWFI